MSSTTTFSEADDGAPEGHEDVAPLQDVKIQIADPVEVNIGKGDVKAASVAPKIEVKEEKSERDVLSQAIRIVLITILILSQRNLRHRPLPHFLRISRLSRAKGKAGIVKFDDGSSWLFGKRCTFEPGQLQQEPQPGTFQRGPDLDDYWRSGTGRWGGRAGVGKAWNKVNWALQAHDVATKARVSAKRLFRLEFPKDKKADFASQASSKQDIDQWIKHFMNRAQWETGKGGKAFKGFTGKEKCKGFKGGKGKDKGRGTWAGSSSSGSAPSVVPPPPPPARR